MDGNARCSSEIVVYNREEYSDAVFRLERFTEVGEFTYLGKHFPCVNAN